MRLLACWSTQQASAELVDGRNGFGLLVIPAIPKGDGAAAHEFRNEGYARQDRQEMNPRPRGTMRRGIQEPKCDHHDSKFCEHKAFDHLLKMGANTGYRQPQVTRNAYR